MKRNEHVYWKRLYHSFMIFVIVIGVMIIGMAWYVGTQERKEIAESEEKTISLFSVDKEEKLDRMVKMARQMIQSKATQRYLQESYLPVTKNAYGRLEVREYLNDLYTNYYYKETIYDMFLYFDNTDTIISGVYGVANSEDYIKTHVFSDLSKPEEEVEAVRQEIFEVDRIPHLFLYENNGKECLGISLRYYGSSEKWLKDCCAVFLLNESFYSESMDSMDTDFMLGIQVEDSRKLLAGDYNTALFESTDITDLAEEKSFLAFKKYKINRVESETYPCSYILVIPALPYFWMTYRIVILLGAIVLMIGIVLWIMNFKVTNYAYAPIETLMSNIQQEERMENGEKYDEFRLFQNVLKHYSTNMEDLKNKVSEYEKKICSNYLTRLILGTYDEEDMQALRKHLNWNNDCIYAAALIQKERVLAEGKAERDQALDFFIYKNVIEEILEEYGSGYLLLLGENLYVLVMKLDKSGEADIISHIMEKINSFLKEHFSFSHIIGVGEGFMEMELLHLSYAQAQEALRYQFLCEKNSVISYESIKKYTQNQPFLAEDIERYFVRFIQMEESVDTKQYIKDMLKEIIRANGMNLRGFYMCLSSLAVSLQRFFAEIKFHDESQSVARIANAENLQETEVILAEVLSECKKYFASQKKEDSIAYRVASYIREHYMDSEMSISLLMEQFGISQSYLSRIIKETYGKTVLELIGDVRLEKVKKYLTDTDWGLGEIAEKTGFLSANSLIRFFKSREAITPGKFREMKQYGKTKEKLESDIE
ncbi:hypothetical protein CE91St58_18440 [Lachnospiraceae bacterium]|nr:hypothetical protein CE91St56_28900 [Lachnospiraceae bacterium]GKH41836.1 hypothetical protein CE91St57_28100 [Lachnospiraceae bacterium]GKH54459.1 hypothetical protein CE91St58_18440 [Lachnospiraceae bacterium]